MINWKDIQTKKWVVAVSGGADSMALLDMCRTHGVDVVVAHVNYQKRESADRDMNGVQAYCDLYHIPICIHKVESYQEGYNFQAQAREIRYRFFQRVLQEYHAFGVLVAHQKDDVIETYLMQKQRNAIPMYYGIKEESVMYDMIIRRILFDYTKKDLEDYCEQHGVTYYHDESNFSDHYLRNQIRHSQVDHMSDEEKDEMIQTIQKENERLDALHKEVMQYHLQDTFTKDTFDKIPTHIKKHALRLWIVEHTSIIDVSDKNLSVLVEMMTHKNGNYMHNINEYFYLLCEYDTFSIYEEKDEDYEYHYTMPIYETRDEFTIAKSGKTIEGITLYEDDFPITIRNAREGDTIQLRFGSKKVSRFFIDNKISHKDRKTWPVVVNSKGKIIFVHKIGCDVEHYSNNSTIFVLK